MDMDIFVSEYQVKFLPNKSRKFYSECMLYSLVHYPIILIQLKQTMHISLCVAIFIVPLCSQLVIQHFPTAVSATINKSVTDVN